MSLIKEMWNDGLFGRFLLSLIILTILLVPSLLYVAMEEQSQWNDFKKSHQCKKTDEVKGETQTGVGFGVTANGQIGAVITTSSTPSKIGWLCDDGVTYWR